LLPLVSLAFRRRYAKNAALIALAWLPLAVGVVDMSQPEITPIQAVSQWTRELGKRPPPPLAEGDEDQDGLPDALEHELAQRYAPIVILDKDDWTRPASAPWLLARNDFTSPPHGAALASVAAASASGGATAFSPETRAGSASQDDWVTYVHAYPRVDGGINLQYWFFYPYNDGPLFFDHESDWEHLTVHLDEDHKVKGVAMARHEDNDPGRYRSARSLRWEGDHVVVLSARGSHATYADHDDVPWFEAAGRCDNLARCDHPVWRTWQGGGLANVGERPALLLTDSAMTHPGRWGGTRFFPGTSAPHGPPFARGFCNAGFETCGERRSSALATSLR
jgi:hypothetical protein